MDDPLIGLTIYDTTAKTSDTSFSRLESDKGNTEEKGDGNEDCFPCLPGLPDDPQSPEGTRGADIARCEGIEAPQEDNLIPKPVHQPKNFWLMRLFQSSLFDMSIAIGYLFNSKDQTVQSYLGSKLYVSMYSKSKSSGA